MLSAGIETVEHVAELLFGSVHKTEKLTIVLAHVHLSILPSVRPSEINISQAGCLLLLPATAAIVYATQSNSCAC